MGDTKVYVDGKEVGSVASWDLSSAGADSTGIVLKNGDSMTLTYELTIPSGGTASGTFSGFFDPSAVAKAFGGAMYHYGDVVTSKASGLKLMVIRRISGFPMRRPDEWECLALDADIDPANRIGHWKDEEIE